MKKNILFPLVLVFSLISCDFLDIDSSDSGITAPSIKTSGQQVIITPTTIGTAEYINLFRYEVSGTSADATIIENTMCNIGQSVKTKEYTKTGEIIFIDYYADKTKYYQYFARYKTPNGYLTSKTTATWQGVSTDVPEITRTDSSAPLEIVFNSTNNTLRFRADAISIPDIPTTIKVDELGNPISFAPMIAIYNTGKTQAFELQKEVDSTVSPSIEYWILKLEDRIPESFFGKTLSINGIFGQDIDEHKNGQEESTNIIDYINYYWTLPLLKENISIISSESGETISHFIVTDDRTESDIFDYTDCELTANK